MPYYNISSNRLQLDFLSRHPALPNRLSLARGAKKELHEITLQDLSVGPADLECKTEASPVNVYPGPSAPSGGLLFNCLW